MLGCGDTDARLAPKSVSAILDGCLEAAHEALRAIGAQRHCDSEGESDRDISRGLSPVSRIWGYKSDETRGGAKH